jgi:hypothetical protein
MKGILTDTCIRFFLRLNAKGGKVLHVENTSKSDENCYALVAPVV